MSFCEGQSLRIRYAIRTAKIVVFLSSVNIGVLDTVPSIGLHATTLEEEKKLTQFLKILIKKEKLPDNIVSIMPIPQPEGDD